MRPPNPSPTRKRGFTARTAKAPSNPSDAPGDDLEAEIKKKIKRGYRLTLQSFN